MQHSPCKNCGSSDIHYGNPAGYTGSLQTKAMTFSVPKLTFFVCCSCGNVEISVPQESDRQKIAHDWPQVEAT
jgi:hypothetical protein